MRNYLFSTLSLIFLCLNIVQAQETDPSFLSRGLQLFNEQKYENALTEFEKVIKNDPLNKEAYYYRGLTFLKVEKYSEAITPFKKVLELDPKYSGARRNLGIAYLNLQFNDLALQDLTKSIDQDPHDADAYFYLGRVFQQKEQYQESLIYFQTVLSLDPDLEQVALFQIGLAYVQLGQKEDAKLALTLALEKDPQSNIAEEVENRLKELRGEISKSMKKGWFQAKLGWQFDDNVSVTKQDLVTNQSDYAAIFELSTGYKFYSSPVFDLQGGYDFYQNAWSDVAELNYISNTFSLSGSHNDKNWDAGIDYYFNYSFLDEKDFLTSHSLVIVDP
jgi:tetratricopeptide (TPR) repeat protein